MLAHLLRRRGITAAVTPLAVPLDEAFKAADQSAVRATFISALPPSAVGAARQLCRRLKARSPNTPALVGLWRHRASIEELEKRLHASGPDEIVSTLADAVEQLEAMVSGSRPPTHSRPPTPARPRPPAPVAAESTPPVKGASKPSPGPSAS